MIGPKVKSYQGKEWKISEHHFDWIFERDGIGWAVEIKNTWAYIDKTEMETKGMDRPILRTETSIHHAVGTETLHPDN